ncbi:MAG TPA: envelope stress response membrane protein PspB [Allosphingosinicella sp.]|nr:envelope stress response membrane protein PspB [Allosphingosinicella sp.]
MHASTFLLAIFMIFVALPWIIFNSITQWKKNGSLTREDEALMDELYELARRLDDRVRTVERIVTAENPHWKEIAGDAPIGSVADNTDTLRRIK